MPSDRAGFFDHVAGGTAHDFRRRAIEVLEQMGISVEFSHHEGGPGQNEIDLRFADALSMADNIMTFRAVVEEIALEEGYMLPSCLSLLKTNPAQVCTPTFHYLKVNATPSSTRQVNTSFLP